MVVYDDIKSNLVKVFKDNHCRRKDGTSCSKNTDCSVIKSHKLEVNMNGKIYNLDVNKKRYQKIGGIKKYIYAAISNGKIEVYVARNYAVD